MRYLIILAFVVNYCSNSSLAGKIQFADNEVIAHRGAWKAEGLPQNSIAALKHAILLNCTGSEFDVRMTQDDVLIVTHDHDYHDLIIEESTYEELAEFKLSNGETLPTLREFLKAGMTDNPSTGLVLEIKPSKIQNRNIKITDQVLALVKELGADAYISSYISFSYEMVKRIEEVNPDAITMYLDGSLAPERLKADGINGMDYHLYKYKQHPEWISDAKSRGLDLNAWTANKVEDIDWLLANEFDFITTDEPELVFERKKLEPTEKDWEKVVEKFEDSSRTSLKLMTYNIRLDVASDGENAWPNRKNFLTSQVLFLDPDILGVQEAKPNQIKDLDSVLVQYDHIGIGRNGGNEDEHSSIYYKKDKLKVEQQNTIWLSETPTEVSKGWDAAYPRICTYGLFSVKDGGAKFWVFNTHLDHKGEQAQKEGMKLILKKISEVNVGSLPVMLMGDFNVEPMSDVIGESAVLFSDAKDLAEIDFGPEGTFNGFKYNDPVRRRIDYILVSKSPAIKVKKYAVLSSAIDFKFPSDHFPVFVEVRF